MLAALIRFSLGQRLLVLVLTGMLTGAGIYAFLRLPIDAFPDVSTTQVKIILKAPGMTPEEVETRLAVPVEQEMLGIPHQRLLRSVSEYALTDITIDFEDGTDIYWARQQGGESGSGLGLAIVARIAEPHGAAVALGDSGDASGLRISVSWPRIPRDGVSSPPEATTIRKSG